MDNKYQSIMAKFGAVNSKDTTTAQLKDIESRLGYPLPADYRELLLDYSDCHFVVNTAVVYPFTKDGYDTFGSISKFYNASSSPNLADIEGYYRGALEQDLEEIDYYLGVGLLRSIEGIKEIGWPEELLPIGCDAGGNQICLALFGLRPESIFYWMNCPSFGGHSPYLIANSFDEFMHLLRIDD